jgi:hypothetical protein
VDFDFLVAIGLSSGVNDSIMVLPLTQPADRDGAGKPEGELLFAGQVVEQRSGALQAIRLIDQLLNIH